MSPEKSVLIIGAGVCGLTVIKSSLEEGLSVTCYEMTSYVGGLWKYKDEDLEGAPSMFKNLYTNVSKEMSAFSDFPPPKEFPNYMHHSLFQRYFELYAQQFHLTEHIKFGYKVTSVTPNEDFEVTGRWRVEAVDLLDQNRIKEGIFDAVVVATGQHSFPITPNVSGLEDFKGQTMHSRSYKKPEPFTDKRVLVYGFGNSAGDVATDLAKNAKKVYLSCKTKKWVVKRFGLNGQFPDRRFMRRYLEYSRSFIPSSWLNSMAEKEINTITDHNFLGLKPDFRVLEKLPVVSDTLPICIVQGMIEMKPNIKRLTSEGVIFEDSESQFPIDAIIFCTGFQALFPFLSKDLIDFHNRPEDVYKSVFPIHLRHHTLAFMGLTIPGVAVTVVAEMEGRWIAKIFSGKLALPTKEIMTSQTQQYLTNLRAASGEVRIHRSYVFGFPYIDELASVIGVRPKLGKMMLTDPKLFLKCFFGSWLPYQYRLNGPNSWTGARNAIFTADDRIRYPFFMKDSVQKKDRKNGWWTSITASFVCAFAAWYFIKNSKY